MRVVFGVCCYNEAANLPALLEHLASLKGTLSADLRILVVSDACSDGTDEGVRSFASRSPLPVRLVVNSERRGKAAAVNRILDESVEADVIVLVSADALPERECIPLLLRALEQEGVGVAAARPEPRGPKGNPAMAVSRLMYRLHHRVAARFPKSTEIIAFRNPRERIPEESLVDEAELEYLMKSRGLRVVYVPEAVILTHPPLSLSEYFRQRSRVTLGHLRLASRTGYRVGTLDLGNRFRYLWEEYRQAPLSWAVVLLAAVLETGIFLHAALAFRMNRSVSPLWPRSATTKRNYGSGE